MDKWIKKSMIDATIDFHDENTFYFSWVRSNIIPNRGYGFRTSDVGSREGPRLVII